MSFFRKRRRPEQQRRSWLDPVIDLPGGLEKWVEESMDWFVDQFGPGPLERDVVRPSDLLPVRYDGSEAAARELCLKVCERLEVQADDIRFSFRAGELRAAARSRASRAVQVTLRRDSESSDSEKATRARELLAITGLPDTVPPAEFKALEAAGFEQELHILALDETLAEIHRCQQIRLQQGAQREAALQTARAYWDGKSRSPVASWRDLRRLPQGGASEFDASAIMLSASSISDPADLVAQVVHELGHEVLNRGRVDLAQPDCECLVDLYGVFNGFGIFSLNRALEPAGFLRTQRLGYLGQRGMTEALAGYLCRRHQLLGESLDPSWVQEVDWELRRPLADRARELAAKTA